VVSAVECLVPVGWAEWQAVRWPANPRN
jgi:hypothetical protein